jgi:hypothetical protein
MGQESIRGRTGAGMKGNISMIRNTGLGPIRGRMGGRITAGGNMGASMERGSIQCQMAPSGKGSGSTENGSAGLIKVYACTLLISSSFPGVSRSKGFIFQK